MAFLQVPKEYAEKTTDQIVEEAGSGPLPLIEPGKYPAVIVASELKDTANKLGQFLQFKIVLTQGQFKDTEFYERLNIVNQNETAVKIAYQTLAKIAKASGFATIPAQSELFHNKVILVEVKTEKGEDFRDKKTGEMRKGKDKSVIAGYDAMPQVGAPSAIASASVHPTQAPMPWQK